MLYYDAVWVVINGGWATSRYEIRRAFIFSFSEKKVHGILFSKALSLNLSTCMKSINL